MSAAVLAFDLHVPRHAVSPRGAVRPGDVWRLCQETAVLASAACGWPPERYTAAQTGFIIVRMTVRHHRELAYGERLQGRTWVRDFRRGMFSRREVRIEGSKGPVADASQEWVHVRAQPQADGKVQIGPARAGPEMLAAFPPLAQADPPVALPPLPAPTEGAPHHSCPIQIHQGWMDPLGHVNHPVYLDWCDEGTMRALAAAGLDPQGLVPVMERVRYKTGVVAGETVRVHTQVGGLHDQAVVLHHRILGRDGALRAAATTLRTHVSCPSRDLAQILTQPPG